MNVLYVATDVSFPGGLGGSRRVLETARTFAKNGHSAYVLTAVSEGDIKDIKSIKIYRKKFVDLLAIFRKIIQFFKKDTEQTLSKFDSHLDFKQTLSWKDKLKEFFRHKFPIHKLIKNLQSLPLLLKIIKNERIDLIIERGPSYGVGIIAAKLTNRPCMVDFIDILYWNWALKKADGILSYFIDIQVPKSIPREKITIVKMTVDPEKFKSQPTDPIILEKYRISADEIIYIYIGGMYSWHGLDDILDAAIMLQKTKLKFKVLLVGMGEMFPIIKKRIESEGLDENIIMTGRLPFDQVPKLLNVSDITLSLNTGDAVGFKIVEYMASGRAMIATDVDIMSRVAAHLKESYLVPPNDPKALYEAMKVLGNDRELRLKIAKNARRKVELEYSWDQHIKTILNAFKNNKH
jgi:glycosyltransferase involved in cell wall biosynthesis